jgi:nicotinate-nucleotide adenylyltransferase
MEVILFGGSFDPIHKGHLEIIKKATKIADKVIVIPNYLNPLKNSFSAPAELRLKWLKKSINNPKVEISDFEIKQNKSCYTIDTIKHFKQNYDKISFLIGADNLLTLNRWKNIEELKKLVNFIVVTRDNIPIKGYQTINIDIPISSTDIRKNLETKYLPENLKGEIIKYYKGLRCKKELIE